MAVSRVTPTGADPKVKEFIDWFSYAENEFDENRREGATDMRVVSGDPWSERDRQQREKANRPVVTFDEIGQYINQVVNDVRANPIAVKFSPVGGGASEASAQFYQDKMREIEYRSNAQVHYTTAFENAVSRGYGFVRVTTRYEHERSANQDLWIEGFPNPDLVTPDPDALMPDLSDQRRCIVRQPYTHDEFRRRFGKNAKITTFGRDQIRSAKQWVDVDRVYVGEVWEIDSVQKRLLIIAPPVEAMATPQANVVEPIGVFEDELQDGKLPAGYTLLTERKADVPVVKQYLTNGLELLGEPRKWAGKYIPIIGCFGKIMYLPDGAGGSKRTLASMVRLARDPFMLYCYYRATEAELVGMTPKFPWFIYEGQLDPAQLKLLQKSNKVPVTVIQVKPTLPGVPPTVLVPPPQRNPYEPPIAALEVGAESARRAIQAAMGWTPLPTQAQRQNEKSGVALKRIENASQRGSFHYVDHYQGMIRHVGIVCEDLMDKILDNARSTGVRTQNEESSSVRINDPRVPESVSTKGSHLVTVSTGPSADSTREAASEFADILMNSPLAPRIGDLVVKLKQLGPIGDELADRLTPPEFAKQGKDGKPDAKQLMMQLAQSAARLKQLEGVAASMKQALDNEGQKQRAETARTLINAELQVHLQAMKNAADIEKARIAAAKDAGTAAVQASEERVALGMEQAHEASEAALDRTHERALAHFQTQRQALLADQAAGHDDDAAMRDASLGDRAAARDAVIADQAATRDAALAPPAVTGGA